MNISIQNIFFSKYNELYVIFLFISVKFFKEVKLIKIISQLKRDFITINKVEIKIKIVNKYYIEYNIYIN